MPLNETSQFEQTALKNYLLDHAYDEMFEDASTLHPHYAPLLEHFRSLPAGELQRTKCLKRKACWTGITSRW